MILLPVAVPLVVLLLVLVELRVLAYAYRKIGINPRYVFAVMILTIIGSHVNLPLYSIPVEHLSSARQVVAFGRSYVVPGAITHGTTVVAINVGGALIPALVSL